MTKPTMLCAPAKDSDQLGHEESLGPYLPIEYNTKIDQSGWMPRRFRVFAGRTCHFVGFVVYRLMSVLIRILKVGLTELPLC